MLTQLKIIFIVFLVLAVGALAMIGKNLSATETAPTATIKLTHEIITVKILTTPNEQRKGLSDLLKLKPHEGVLMIFPEPDFYSIWMANMSFPIDVVWLDANNKIVYLVENMTPASYPKTFTPATPALKILETNINTIKTNNLRIGDYLNIKN